MVVINLQNNLTAQQHYIFSISVRNPKYVVQNGGFEIRTLLKYANKIIEKSDSLNSLQVNPLNWGSSNSKLKVLLGWGVDKSQANLPPQFTFFRGSSSANPFKFYNAIKFMFSPSYETGAGVKLKVILNLAAAEANFEVLSGSISENLPDFGNEKVYCELDKTTLLNKVICYNVGVLSNLSNYHIGLKAFFPYDAANTNLVSDFGKLSIYTYNSKNLAYDAIPLISEGRCQTIAFSTMNNLNNALPNNAGYCYTMAHSQTGTNIIGVTPTNCGIKKKASSLQNLVFTFTTTPAMVYSGGFNTFAGLFNNKIKLI